MAQREGRHAGRFRSHPTPLGRDIRMADVTPHGGIDMRVRLDGRAVPFEFEVVEISRARRSSVGLRVATPAA
jgi:hypothetical protein